MKNELLEDVLNVLNMGIFQPAMFVYRRVINSDYKGINLYNKKDLAAHVGPGDDRGPPTHVPYDSDWFTHDKPWTYVPGLSAAEGFAQPVGLQPVGPKTRSIYRHIAPISRMK